MKIRGSFKSGERVSVAVGVMSRPSSLEHNSRGNSRKLRSLFRLLFGKNEPALDETVNGGMDSGNYTSWPFSRSRQPSLSSTWRDCLQWLPFHLSGPCLSSQGRSPRNRRPPSSTSSFPFQFGFLDWLDEARFSGFHSRGCSSYGLDQLRMLRFAPIEWDLYDRKWEQERSSCRW